MACCILILTYFLKVKMKCALTYKRHHKDPEEDPERVADDVHEDDGDEGHRQVELTLPLLAPPPAQNLNIEQ